MRERTTDELLKGKQWHLFWYNFQIILIKIKMKSWMEISIFVPYNALLRVWKCKQRKMKINSHEMMTNFLICSLFLGTNQSCSRMYIQDALAQSAYAHQRNFFRGILFTPKCCFLSFGENFICKAFIERSYILISFTMNLIRIHLS